MTYVHTKTEAVSSNLLLKLAVFGDVMLRDGIVFFDYREFQVTFRVLCEKEYLFLAISISRLVQP